MTIKLELPKNDPIVLNEMGLALTRIAAALKGDSKITNLHENDDYVEAVNKTVESLSETFKPESKKPLNVKPEVVQIPGNIANATITGTTDDEPQSNVDKLNAANVFAESGPFYWVEKASCTCGHVATLAELDSVTGVRCTYDEFLQYNEDFNGVETVQPPIVQNDEIGADGVPWDKRIHSKGKTKNKAGNLNLRKRPATFETKEAWVSYVDEIKAELLGVMSAPVTETVTPPVVETVTPPVITETVTPPVITETVTPPVITETVTPPVVDTSAPVVDTFQKLLMLITTNNAKINSEQVKEVLAKHKVTALPLMAQRVDLIPQVAVDIQAVING